MIAQDAPAPLYDAPALGTDATRIACISRARYNSQIDARARRDLGGDVTGNGVSKLVFTILSAVAEAERDRTRERITEVKADQKKRGRYLGGVVPFGYRQGEDGALVELPEQQKAIETMRRLRAKGVALRAIADKLTAAGTPISHMGVSKVLRAAEQRAAA